MDGLPVLPGNSYTNPARSLHHVGQSLVYNKGYQIPASRVTLGIGGQPLNVNDLNDSDLDALANFQPTLTYGKAKQAPPQDFVPAHVAFDKKVLRFYGYFKETVHESPNEHYRVRHVNIYYYLEDDSIAIVEPPVENSGIPQGKFLRRQRLPKNEVGDFYNWKDINLGTNLCVYGKVFRITDCDKFTRDFLTSEGIIVGQPESRPDDPYLTNRQNSAALKTSKTPSSFDKRKQFLEMDRKVLRFYAIWDEREQMFGDCRIVIIHYYLVDDTMEVREVHQANDGRDPFPVLIRRGFIPKDRFDVPPTFPSCVLELSANEIKQNFSPKDFRIGETVLVLGRRFMIYDCDNFTKAWYYKTFGITDFTPVKVDSVAQELARMEIPPYNHFGSFEDSLGSCIALRPEPSKKDYIKLIDQDTAVLRYEAFLDSIRAEDKGRRFIIAYRLADDMMTIYETPARNSGITGGTFLARSRVAKPGSTPDKPDYYGPADFKMGAKIDIFGNRFEITSADQFVLKYLEANSGSFPPDVIESLRQRLNQTDSVCHKEGKNAPIKLNIQPGDEDRVANEIASQLKKMAITDRMRIDEMFLRYNTSRQGFVTLDNFRDMCRKMQLPDDPLIVQKILNKHGTDGKMSLEEFRKFFES